MSELTSWVNEWAEDAAKAISEGNAKRAIASIDNMTAMSKDTSEIKQQRAELKRQVRADLGCDEAAAVELVSALRIAAISAGGNAAIEPHPGNPPTKAR